jgi:hypothetical protein
LREGSGEGLSADASALDQDTPSPGPSREREGRQTPERTCILTRDGAPREALIRLALSPDGALLPDVRAKAPGRGAWIGVDRTALEKAQANGKLRGVLQRAFKGAALSIPDDLANRIAEALRQQALDRLGLEARAGTLLTGAERIETAARKGDVHLLIHASDAGEDGRRKLDQAWRMGRDPSVPLGMGEAAEPAQGLVFPLDRTILSLALGRQNVVHVALTDRAAAARVRHALERWRAFIGSEAGQCTASAVRPDASAVDE